MSRDALVVGINTYSHLKPLKAPAHDAEAIARILEKDGDFQTVRRLPEAIDQSNGNTPKVGQSIAVSQTQLEQALKQLFKPDSSQAPDTALFYFSGHGLRDPDGEDGLDKGYLATSDTNPAQARPGVSLAWLQNLLARSPVKNQIVWLDCCHSGGLLIDVGAANPGHSNDRNRCFIASSRDFEQSWQDLNSPYSVLTKALLEGLDPTRLQGRWVDSFALVDYVNQALKGELQKPICTNFGEAINLTRTWQVETESARDATDTNDICPYKGLEYFDFNDEDPKYFFGREQLTGQLLDQVRTSNFMALVGASGNGKSSVLRAGLLHQLKRGRRIAGSDQWRIRLTRPDRQPLRNLALAFVDETAPDLERAEQLGKAERLIEKGADGLRRLVQTDSAPKVILVIDQFEEVFTRCEDVEEREQFFACLMGALAETEDKLCLILALRADFVGKCLERDYSGLADRVQQGMVNVLPMALDDLRDAIGKPAEQVGLTVEPALLTEILDDIAGAPGSLPLLQYTLKELWQQRQNNQLVLSAYHALGGINGTLDQKATEIYNRFNESEQRTVQHIFQQLTQLGEGTEDTRRRVFQDNLVAEPKHSAEQVNRVIATLAAPENRLLVTSEVISKGSDAERMAIVDVAHEALIRHWRLLRQWVEQNRDLLRQQRYVETRAQYWNNDPDKNSAYLLRGSSLEEAKKFLNGDSYSLTLTTSAQEFIKASLLSQNQATKKRTFKQISKTIIFWVGALSGALTTAFNAGMVEVSENTIITAWFTLRGSIVPPKELVILAIDEDSLAQGEFYRTNPGDYREMAPLASWPWQRTAYAIAIERLLNAGAQSIAINLIFDEPSSWGDEDDQQLLNTLQMANGRVTIAASYEDQVLFNEQKILTQLTEPIPAFRTDDVKIGYINFWRDLDGKIHRLPMNFPLMFAKLYTEQTEQSKYFRLNQELPSLVQASLASARIEVDYPQGHNTFYYGGSGTFPRVSFWTLINSETWEKHLNDKTFQDKIVLVGPTTGLFRDMHDTPMGVMPGVEVQANAIATLLEDKSISQLLPNSLMRGVLVFLFVLGASSIFNSRENERSQIFYIIVIPTGLISLSFVLFLNGWILPTAIPLLAFFFIVFARFVVNKGLVDGFLWGNIK